VLEGMAAALPEIPLEELEVAMIGVKVEPALEEAGMEEMEVDVVKVEPEGTEVEMADPEAVAEQVKIVNMLLAAVLQTQQQLAVEEVPAEDKVRKALDQMLTNYRPLEFLMSDVSDDEEDEETTPSAVQPIAEDVEMAPSVAELVAEAVEMAQPCAFADASVGTETATFRDASVDTHDAFRFPSVEDIQRYLDVRDIVDGLVEAVVRRERVAVVYGPNRARPPTNRGLRNAELRVLWNEKYDTIGSSMSWEEFRLVREQVMRWMPTKEQRERRQQLLQIMPKFNKDFIMEGANDPFEY
jgi:hypothetical protein